MIARFLQAFRELITKRCGRGVAAFRVAEDEGLVEASGRGARSFSVSAKYFSAVLARCMAFNMRSLPAQWVGLLCGSEFGDGPERGAILVLNAHGADLFGSDRGGGVAKAGAHVGEDVGDL